MSAATYSGSAQMSSGRPDSDRIPGRAAARSGTSVAAQTSSVRIGSIGGSQRRGLSENHESAGKWWRVVGWRHVVGILAVIYAAFPILYVLSAALNPSTRTTLNSANSMFSAFSLSNFQALGQDTMFWTWFGNTLEIGIITSIASTLMATTAAYAFSRYRFAGRKGGLLALLVVQMFPQLLAFIAIFLLLNQLGQVVPILGLDSKLSLICVYLGGALGANTFLLYGTFNSIPRELDEAAKIDGATHAQVFWTIVMPLVVPMLAVVALLSFIGAFNDYVIASTVLTSQDNWTLAIGMQNWVGGNEKQWGWFTAGAVIAAIPILLLFLFLQRYIVAGLTGGSVKG
ncbi:sugar ABC transporter permease [Neoactinobaculum massilliense]|uniref:sugar ABC transporter permease n=1 Tax=Neoactinobaculum massilliense TaxID=2364794 RepID=UPI001F14CFDC|nr:sugar ABC transporter permease [Neoactinobaculum massilliense]